MYSKLLTNLSVSEDYVHVHTFDFSCLMNVQKSCGQRILCSFYVTGIHALPFSGPCLHQHTQALRLDLEVLNTVSSCAFSFPVSCIVVISMYITCTCSVPDTFKHPQILLFLLKIVHTIVNDVLGRFRGKPLYKRQPYTIVVLAFKNGCRDAFAKLAAPSIKVVSLNSSKSVRILNITTCDLTH